MRNGPCMDVAGVRDVGTSGVGAVALFFVCLFVFVFKVGMDDDDIRGKIRLQWLLRKPLSLTVGGRAFRIEQRGFLLKTGQALSYWKGRNPAARENE